MKNGIRPKGGPFIPVGEILLRASRSSGPGGQHANVTASRIEAVFDVKVTNVNTINRHGKKRRTKAGWGKRPDTKRAIVSVADGQRIDIFGSAGV